MQKTFEARTAVITGAGSGIGYCIALQLAAAGASVVLNDKDAALAEKAAAAIVEAGGRAIPLPGDVSELSVLQDLVDAAVAGFGQLDIAIANAGITTFGDFFEYRPEDFQRLLAVNLQGSFFLAQFAARQMRQQGKGGRILLMSSVTGVQAHRYLAAYGMTKAGLQMLAKALVPELAPYQITINAIAPGATLTERTSGDDPGYREVWEKITPNQRVSTPEDMASAALFLVSPQALQITGQTLVIDGGWTSMSPEPFF
ncbi:MAG: hypothetical protein RI973_792 [Bacteroidota bacterium]|jgi:3-oxoacyl-[acyl-carrier protein] reductase